MFEIVEECDPTLVLEKEQIHLDAALNDPAAKVYNLAKNVFFSGPTGLKRLLTQEEKSNLRLKAQKQFSDPIEKEKHLIGVRKANAKVASFVLIDPNGVKYEHIYNLALFCKEHGLNVRHIYDIKVKRNNRTTEKGWRMEHEQTGLVKTVES